MNTFLDHSNAFVLSILPQMSEYNGLDEFSKNILD